MEYVLQTIYLANVLLHSIFNISLKTQMLKMKPKLHFAHPMEKKKIRSQFLFASCFPPLFHPIYSILFSEAWEKVCHFSCVIRRKHHLNTALHHDITHFWCFPCEKICCTFLWLTVPNRNIRLVPFIKESSLWKRFFSLLIKKNEFDLKYNVQLIINIIRLKNVQTLNWTL